MKIALLSCSSKKHSLPCPAKLLYSRSPRFCMIYNYAKNLDAKLYIVSGKYGLISPNKVINPYDIKIDQNDNIIPKIKEGIIYINPEIIYSFLTKNYKNVLKNINIPVVDKLLNYNLFEQAKLFKTGNRLIYPERVIFWIIEYIYKQKRSIKEIKQEMNKKGYHPKTIQAQLYRLYFDPFIYYHKGYFCYRLENDKWIKDPFIDKELLQG